MPSFYEQHNASTSISLDKIDLRRPNYPDNCRTLDIADGVKNSGIKEVYFEFSAPLKDKDDERRPISIEIRIEDRLRQLDKANKFAKLSYSGH